MRTTPQRRSMQLISLKKATNYLSNNYDELRKISEQNSIVYIILYTLKVALIAWWFLVDPCECVNMSSLPHV